ncbi:MAG: glycosyltransferase family 2 protein [Proteobacteria bacterium]|nr:glycosyltransferase family 2 protein [Pseudomonadota bacterium]
MEQATEILIIVPAYNEEENIAEVLTDLGLLPFTVDVVVVDDGSTDGTAGIVESCGVPLLRLPFNLGIGGAMQAGYRYARENGYDLAVQFDGDGQHRADQIRVLLAGVEQTNADLVIGSRFMDSGVYAQGVARMIGGRILAMVLSFLTGWKISDPTSGFRVAGRDAICFFAKEYPDDYPEPEIILLLKKGGKRCAEVPVLMCPRTGGKSSITPIRSVYYMVKVLLALMVDLLRVAWGDDKEKR